MSLFVDEGGAMIWSSSGRALTVTDGVACSSVEAGGVTGTTGSCSPSRVEMELEIDPIGKMEGVFGAVSTSPLSSVSAELFGATDDFRLRTKIRTACPEANVPLTPTTPAANSLPPLSLFDNTE